ncbi:hypothetical protein [Paenibacillus oryzae]|uniref:hypothetical protein n=1 Tax=Paenibacillus oryzae TaxID=1844972 RepID=UPI001FE008BF|nr:hypothetical protein [Paenibacillus oryzae]
MTSRSIYILSGPAGVGKSTTSKKLVQQLERSSYISGDVISHLRQEIPAFKWVNEA